MKCKVDRSGFGERDQSGVRCQRSVRWLAVGIAGALLLSVTAMGSDSFESIAKGSGAELPAGYAPPLISNGSLCLLIDYQGCQFQQPYLKMIPAIWWAGRRYDPVGDASRQLVPFGHFRHALSTDGTALATPGSWSQTLNTREAVVTCRTDYGQDWTLETVVFAPLGQDLIVVQKRLSTSAPAPRPATITFQYQFTAPGEEKLVPRRMACTSRWNDKTQSADFRYHLDGHRSCEGLVSVFCDKQAVAAIDGQTAELSVAVSPRAGQPEEMTFCLAFADSLDGREFEQRVEALRARVREDGFDAVLAAHRREWSKYWEESWVQLPEERLEKAYCTAQYHLRANATKWSFPVGTLPTHWAGKFFGWDEMFCYQALISSNHRDIARRCPEFRFAGLQKALYRASHYGKPGLYGARFPWEALEDGSEGAPPGFWMEHVFHMSNIATSAWFQYLYTSDAAYLKEVGYPVVKECARFFLANMIYQQPDGGMVLGKCTDLERLGPARENPFMTSCGAIYTLESAAAAGELLQMDGEECVAWREAAKQLRASLPNDGTRYLPYAGCAEQSVASLGGLFPYPVFDQSNELQRNAARHFIEHGRASGNMYPVGNSVCAWYAGWMAAALAALGDKTEPGQLLAEAAGGAGCFGEMFEINEAKVAMRPWFATASGNLVYAVNQMLVQSRGHEIRIGAGVPGGWRDYAFKLACHGDLVIEVEVRDGRLNRLVLLPGDESREQQRTLVLPSAMLGTPRPNLPMIKSVVCQGESCRMEVQIKGRTGIIEGDRT